MSIFQSYEPISGGNMSTQIKNAEAEEAKKVIAFLDSSITAGATKAYLSQQDYERFCHTNEYTYNFRAYRKANPRGMYKRKLMISVNKT